MCCKRSFAGILLLPIFVAFVFVRLGATPTPYQFSGTIVSATDHQTPDLGLSVLESIGIAIGDTFTVSFVADPEAVDQNSLPGTGLYVFPSSPITANVAGHTLSSTGLFVTVQNDATTLPQVDFVAIHGMEPYASTINAPFELSGMVLGFASTNSDLITNGDFFIPRDLSPFDEDRRFVFSVRTNSSEVQVTGLFSQTVPSPEDQITGLMSEINSLDAGTGTTKSLNAILANSLVALARGNEIVTCAMVRAFAHEVQGQADRNLTAAQAAQLIDAATGLLTSLGCS